MAEFMSGKQIGRLKLSHWVKGGVLLLDIVLLFYTLNIETIIYLVEGHFTIGLQKSAWHHVVADFVVISHEMLNIR
jgi:hypothetical protein